jgi:hypothetical protein
VFEGTMQAFAWIDCGKQRKISFRIEGSSAGIRIGYVTTGTTTVTSRSVVSPSTDQCLSAAAGPTISCYRIWSNI